MLDILYIHVANTALSGLMGDDRVSIDGFGSTKAVLAFYPNRGCQRCGPSGGLVPPRVSIRPECKSIPISERLCDHAINSSIIRAKMHIINAIKEATNKYRKSLYSEKWKINYFIIDINEKRVICFVSSQSLLHKIKITLERREKMKFLTRKNHQKQQSSFKNINHINEAAVKIELLMFYPYLENINDIAQSTVLIREVDKDINIMEESVEFIPMEDTTTKDY
ncbi:hypothetical protein RF11_11029 [Thelohanellus kitauei]|uniref:Uncharacterized protein n=1 Tax=Thelohanellus kitauei TaxID=669202 RepID=A0A0C2MU60_THEKT|nr:hypothetical protein RF11_11029 [Thelohanellus kitauei]